MSGVTWTERKEGMWLASNGRWYPPDTYPRGWDMSALPPAPGQVETGSASQVLRRLRNVMDVQAVSPATIPTGVDTAPTVDSAPTFRPQQPPPDHTYASTSRPQPTPPTARAQASAARAERERQVAEARIARSSTYSPRLPSAPPAPRSIGAPPPPGRVATTPPPPATSRPPAPSKSKTIVAGDLGAVFGAARAKIEQAINEAELK